MAKDFAQTRIEMLRRRWEEEASPHVSLQLADLYRQQERLHEALPVLQRGLERHPESVSLRVALGRYNMEASRAPEAVEVLKDVVDRDPSHLVANKLLVKAYLLVGDVQSARDRLDLYVLLNDSDPEIENLERRVTAGAAAARARDEVEEAEEVAPPSARQTVETQVPPAPAPAPPASPAPAARTRQDPFSLGTASAAPDLAAVSRPGALPAAPAAASSRTGAAIDEAAASREVSRPVRREPFMGLSGSLGDASDWSGLAAGGIFHAPGGAPAALREEPVAASFTVEPAEPEASAEAEVAPPLEVESWPPAAPPPAEERPEPQSEPEPAIEAQEEAQPVAEAAAEAEPSWAATQPATSESATTTLGKLFLSQGYLEDAEKAFHQVLEREPDNAAALAGLEEVRERRGLTAPPKPSSKAAERKIEALRDYLSRFKAATGRREV